MKNKALILLLLICFVSCVKNDPGTNGNNNKPEQELGDFNWSTVSQKPVTVSSLSNLINQEGDIIATNLTPGIYNITTGDYTTLSLQSVPESVASKAQDDNKDKDKQKVIYFPGKDKYATLMAEDLFPNTGDYDMNDVVFNYRIEFIYNKKTDLVNTIILHIKPRAAGSSFEQIGVGLNFTGQSVVIKSVENTGVAATNANPMFAVNNFGVENGTSAVPITNDFRMEFESYASGILNTYKHLPTIPGKEFSVTITLDKELYYNDITLFGKQNMSKTNLDLFVVIKSREREIHLRGQQPTPKFDRNLFSKDMTDFVTKDNLVWLLTTDKEVSHALENIRIEAAYPNFTDWVVNRGDVTGPWWSKWIKENIYEDHKFSDK